MSIQTTAIPQLSQALLHIAKRDNVELPPELLARIPDTDHMPIDIQDALWDVLCSASDDPLYGLTLGLSFQPGHLDIVGLMLMSCENLGEAIEVLLDYHPVLGDAADIELLDSGTDYQLVYRPKYAVQQAQRVDAAIACVLNLARWITGKHGVAKLIRLVADAQKLTESYDDLLQTHCIFNAEHNALVFSRASLNLPLIQANPDVFGDLQQLSDAKLARLDAYSLTATVQSLIWQRPNWSRDRIAGELEMSGPDLTRRLQEEGTTYRLLRCATLRQQAEEYLATENNSIADVARKLGFFDVTAFTKSFKRWTGNTPAAFRENHT